MKGVISGIMGLMLVLGTVVGAVAAESAEVYNRWGDLELLGDGPHYLEVGAGVFDVIDGDEASVAGTAEWRFGRKFHFLGPALGVMANLDGGVFGYGVLYADLAYRDLVLTLSWGAGAYEEGDSRDMGGVFQFRSAGTLAYRLHNEMRVGIKYAHVSNADLHDQNPGEDELHLTLAIPF